MTLEEFSQYFERQFFHDLMDLQRACDEHVARHSLQMPSACCHHRVPAERAIPLYLGVRLLNSDKHFWVAWYLSTLLHQAVHTYAREHEAGWLERFGAHPLPMAAIGLGCWQAAPPDYVLGHVRDFSTEWHIGCSYFTERCLPLLRETGIDLAQLLESVREDKEFRADWHFAPHIVLLWDASTRGKP